MAVTATVTPGKVFGDSDVITKETLNQLGQPTVSVDGSVGSLALSDGSVTNAKVAGDAAINLTKLEGISRGSVIIGNSSGKGAVVDANDNGKILVGDGTDLNSVAVSGDISLASTGAVTITSGAVEAGMLNTNAAATSGGLEVSSGMKIKDDGIDPLTKLAGHADRKGQLITYDSSGDPAYVTKGTEGYVLRAADGDNPPVFAKKTAVVDMGELPTSSGVLSAVDHDLGYTPTQLSWYIEKVTAGTDSNTGYSQYDRINGSATSVENIRLWMNATQVGGYLLEGSAGFNIRHKTSGADKDGDNYNQSDFKLFIVVG
jgi:hypothetical protein